MLRGVSQAASAESSDVTVGTTTVTGGTDGRVLYDNAGVLGEKTVTGTGSVVLATSPTLVSPILGTPTSGVATNLTGTAAGLTAGTVTTNANLTGDVTSVGNATTLTNAPVIAKVLTGYTSGAGTVASTDSILQAIQKLNGNDATNANLTGPITSVGNATSIASQTGTGTKFVVDTSPTLVTPILGAASATSLTFTSTTGVVGATTNNAAATGSVGESVDASVGSGSAIGISNATPTNVTNVSLTAGDWDISGTIYYIPAGSASVTQLEGSLSTTTAARDLGAGDYASMTFPGTVLPSASYGFALPTRRLSISSTTSLFLVAFCAFSIGTMTTYGALHARRMR